MKLSTEQATLRRVKADALAIFVPEDAKTLRGILAGLKKILGRTVETAAGLDRFKGKNSELLSLFTDKKIASPRLFVVGLGEPKKISRERFRRAAAAAAKRAGAVHAVHLALFLPDRDASWIAPLSPADIAQAIAEGAYLSSYKFDKYISDAKDGPGKVKEITLVHSEAETVKSVKKTIADTRIVCEAACLARDLSNAPPNEIYPESLAEAARLSAEKFGYRIEVWDKKKIEQIGFGGLLAVNAGSQKAPRFIVLEHNAGRDNLQTVVLVGKGVTFDAGGISIKPASGMSEMKMDMSGAAAVIGTLEAASRLGLPLHLVGLIPATENLLGGGAMKPGDIVTHYGGKTSEIDNTDAEGRLILADALGYASTYKPNAVIDLATLTGACVVALGSHATGMMGTDESLMARLETSGEKTFERVWQLPLFDEYEAQIKSDVADVKNVGGRWGGAITAALFLKKFIGDYPWVHLDIAGTAILEEPQPYSPKGGSGVGVRLLVDVLRNWNS